MRNLKVLRHGSHSFTCKLHHACFSFVSVHQMVPPLTEVADIQLQLTTHVLTPKGWKAELAYFHNIMCAWYTFIFIQFFIVKNQPELPSLPRQLYVTPSVHLPSGLWWLMINRSVMITDHFDLLAKYSKEKWFATSLLADRSMDSASVDDVCWTVGQSWDSPGVMYIPSSLNIINVQSNWANCCIADLSPLVVANEFFWFWLPS